LDTKFDEIPVFIKAGAIIRNILFNNMGELEFDELTLDLYYKEERERWCMKMHKMAMIIKGKVVS
jgi:alpha-glucosidase